MQKAILFIDSQCVLCDNLSRLVGRLDKNDKLRIAPLGGQTYRKMKPAADREDDFQYVQMIWNGRMYQGPDVVFKLAEVLGFPYALFGVFKIIPTWLQWKVYNFMAKNRYKWFGKKEHCSINSPKIRQKILP